MSKKVEPQNQHIQVFARCRPLDYSERNDRTVKVVQDKQIHVSHKGNTKSFSFDKAFPPNAKQIDVYKAVVEPLIEEVLMGFNCTVFAYGQTGTGKTYTMEGERTDSHCTWEEDPAAGIIPRSMHQIFDELNKGENLEFSVKVSYLELYNEEIYDLLSASDSKLTDKSKIRLFDDANKKGSVIIQGLEEALVNNKDEVYAILQRGTARRQTAATLCNLKSSRSHAVFSVTVHMKENTIDGEDLLKIGKLNLVDLAGSESVKTSGAIDKRLREAGNINQSLLTLGRVITALIEKQPHIPYRESKLTRLLQDSLGGHTKTSIIATISSDSSCIEETLNTLDYATKAKSITIRPQVNQKMTKRALIREYCEEIERLKKELIAARAGEGFYVDKENYIQMEQEKQDNESKIKDLEDRIDALSKSKEETEEMLNNMTISQQKTSEELASKTSALTKTQMILSKTMTERDENKYIATAHENKNKDLFKEATSLHSTLDLAASDNSKLHSKIDRKCAVEMTNQEKQQIFKTNFNLQTENSITLVTSMQDKQQRSHKQKSEELGVLGVGLSRCKELSQKCLSEGSETESQILTHERDSYNKTESHTHCINDMIHDVADKKETLVSKVKTFTSRTLPTFFEEPKQKGNSWYSWTLQKFKDHKQKLLDMKKIQASQSEKKMALHSQNDTIHDSFYQSHDCRQEKLHKDVQPLSGAYTEKDSAVDSQIDELQALLEQGQALLQQGQAQFQQGQTLFEQGQALLQQGQAQLQQGQAQLQQVTGMYEKMSTKLKDIKHQKNSLNSEMRQNYESTIAEFSNSIKTDVSHLKVEQQLRSSLQAEEERCSQNLAMFDQLAETLSDVSEESSSKHSGTIQSIESAESGTASFLKDIATLSADHSDKCIKDLEHLDSALSEDLQNKEFQMTKTKSLFESLRDDQTLLSEKISALPVSVSRLENLDNEEAKHLSHATEEIKSAFVNRRVEVETFLTRELVQDQPTGATPQRTTYVRPNSLTELSPRDRILARFHSQQHKDVSVPLSLPLNSSFDESEELKLTHEDLNLLTVPPYNDGAESTEGESDSNLSETSEASVGKENRPKTPKSTKLREKSKIRKPAQILPLGVRNTDLKTKYRN